MKVLVIPEDPSLDQYILKPIVERLLADLGKHARVQILSRPRLRGVDQALDADTIADIVRTYPMVDLFLILVDRDGHPKRQDRATALESAHHGLFVCLAIEELEVWMLAAHRDSLSAPWSEIRREPHPKERYAHPFLAEQAPKLDPGQGRAWAMRALAGKWQGVLRACEELETLKQRLHAWIQSPRERA
ncbi:hypothetical protein [Melittangium boletus]|uniref:hypothetical protein n=1 Tax=Melittangium boletus TaxID=83453 RepID=UPI003DA683A6